MIRSRDLILKQITARLEEFYRPPDSSDYLNVVGQSTVPGSVVSASDEASMLDLGLESKPERVGLLEPQDQSILETSFQSIPTAGEFPYDLTNIRSLLVWWKFGYWGSSSVQPSCPKTPIW